MDFFAAQRRRRTGRRYRRRLTPGQMILLLLLLLIVSWLFSEPEEPPPPEAIPEGMARVVRVIDGDTLLFERGVRVRLIGADTPETVKPGAPVEPWGPEATEFTREFIGDGHVRLQFDRERKDRYGRFLAYVWVGEQMLNEELIRAGLARAALNYRFSESMKRRFRRAQNEAQAAQRGIWSTEPVLEEVSLRLERHFSRLTRDAKPYFEGTSPTPLPLSALHEKSRRQNLLTRFAPLAGLN